MQPRARRLTTAVALATVVVLALLGGTAYAAWNVSGSGSGAAKARSLLDPAVSVSSVTSTSVTIQWTATSISGVSYTVTRDGATVSGCGTSSCTDTGRTAGTTYTYVVTTKLGTSWQRSSTVQATTTAVLRSTTTSVTSSQNPSKTSTAVTFTATVAPTSGTGTPTGSVTFQDGASGVGCVGGATKALSGGTATCQVTYGSTGAHSITASYAGDSTFATSTSPTLTQRVVNGNVAGLSFANVKVNGNAATWSCTGTLGSASYTCSTTSGTGNNKVLTGTPVFVASDGTTQVAYATDQPTTLNWTSTGKNAANGTVSVASGASQAGSDVTATMNGTNAAQITVTLSDGLNTFTAILKVS